MSTSDIARIDAELDRIREALARPGLFATPEQRQLYIDILKNGPESTEGATHG